MFLRKFRVKGQTAMKGSDRKKLRADIEQQYKSLTSAEVASLIPNKGDVTQMKISTHSEEIITVYFFEKNPVFFESFKRMYPTVYTLWRFPEMLPVFTTYPPVMNKLLEGADLMLPGVKFQGDAHPKMFGSLQKGDLCLIRLTGNKAPVAIGEALLSGEDMYMSAMRGKGVRPLHIYRDELWAVGSRAEPPLIPDEDGDDDDNDDEGDEDEAEEEKQFAGQTDLDPTAEGAAPSLEQLKLQNQGEDEGPAENEVVAASGDGDVEQEEEIEEGDRSGEEEEEGEGGTAEMDDLLLFCFKCAVKSKITPKLLPLLVSNLLKGYMQPFSPHKRLDLKKSSYKKFSKFLKQMQSEGFIKLKQMSKGVDAITEIDKSHKDLRGLEIPEVAQEEPEPADSGEDKFEPPEITDVICVTADTLPLLKPLGYNKGSVLTTAELRQIVTDYIKANELQQADSKGLVLLDPILAHIALTRKEGDKSHLDWGTLFGRIANKMTPACIIQFPGREPVVKKGKIDPIKMKVLDRSNKKKVTVVQNVEAYGIDPRQFAHLIRCKVAGSANPIPTNDDKHDIHVQGSHAEVIYKYLIEVYKLPRRFVEPVTKENKKR